MSTMQLCSVHTAEGELSLWVNGSLRKNRRGGSTAVGRFVWKLNGRMFNRIDARRMLAGIIVSDHRLRPDPKDVLDRERKTLLAFIGGERDRDWRSAISALIRGGFANDLAICSVACDKAYRDALQTLI